jgi:hypothetical protein
MISRWIVMKNHPHFNASNVKIGTRLGTQSIAIYWSRFSNIFF